MINRQAIPLISPMRILDYEMETISSINDIKHNGAGEHNGHFHIFQINHKSNIKKMK